MGINRLYIIGLIITFIGFLLLVKSSHFISAFCIGMGFILILKSYGDK